MKDKFLSFDKHLTGNVARSDRIRFTTKKSNELLKDLGAVHQNILAGILNPRSVWSPMMDPWFLKGGTDLTGGWANLIFGKTAWKWK